MNADLEKLRLWRTGHASRVLVLHGYDGVQGVTLTEFAAGQRRSATYNSTSTAALAVCAGRVAWKLAGPGMRSGDGGAVEARRRGARNSHGRSVRR